MNRMTLKTLFCLLITSLLQAQTANYDNYVICPIGFNNPIRPLDSDDVPIGRSIIPTSLDLDQTLPGVQSSVTIGSMQFNADATGEVTWTGFAMPAEVFIINYTFTDDLGNISNEGTLRIYFAPSPMISDRVYLDYLPGTTTPPVVGIEMAAYFSVVYPGFTMIGNGSIIIDPSVAPGTYVMNYSAISTPCPSFVVSATVTITVVLLAVNPFEKNAMSIAPNPTKDLINIKANNIIKHLELCDLNGRVLLSTTENAADVSLNIEGFANGVYLLKAATDRTSTTCKVIKK